MKTRKLTSVVLVLCLVMSLVSMCFVGTVSAKTVNANVAGNQYETVLNLTFEGENAGGIAVRNASDVRVEDGALIVGNLNDNNGGIWFAKDGSVNSGVTIPNKMSYTTEDSPAKDTLFELKSNTTYKLTFKYAFRKDMPKTNLLIHLAVDPYLSGSQAQRDGSFSGNCAAVTDGVDAKSGDPVEGDKTYNEWAVETVIFTTEADLTNKYLGMRVNTSGQEKYFKIDDVKLEEYVGETYVFDYKEGETPIDLANYVDTTSSTKSHYGIANYNKVNSSSKEAPNVDADGLHFRPYNNGKFTYDKYAWNHNCFVADADVNYNGQNGIVFDANMLYIVTVKYKIVNMGGNTEVGLGIAVNKLTGIKVANETREVAYKTFTEATPDSQYLTGVVDTGIVPDFAGKTLFLTGYTSNSKQAEILIESVTVTVMDKGADKVAIVKTSETPFVYDVEFVDKGAKVGEYASVKNPVTGAEEDNYNISYVDPEFNFTRVYTDGSTYAYTPNGVNGKTASVATAQDPERGTVLQISSSKDDTTASVCFNGFKPVVGKKYYISVDFKLVENNTDTSLAFNNIFVSAEAGIMMVSNKQDVGEVKLNTKALSTEWTTNEFIYEHSAETASTYPSYDYLLLTCYHHASIDETKPAFIVLADNFVVEEVTEQVEKQMKREGSTRQQEYKDGKYVSAGIRFKGSVSESFRESATEIGFIAAPTAALNGMTMAEYFATPNNTAVSAKVKADGMNEILYEKTTDKYGRTCYDYQLIITGLTREGVESNLLDTDITCVMYAVVDGVTVYTEAFNYCYNDVIYN